MHRPERFTGPARLARGLVLGTALVTLTAGGHAAGQGGQLPGIPALLLLLPLAVALSAAVADRRHSVPWLVCFLLGVQALFHVVLTAIGGHHPAGSSTSVVSGPHMVLGHVVASLAMALLLAHADALLHRWIAFLREVARRVPVLPAILPVLRPVLTAEATTITFTTPVLASVRRRGPPAVA